MKQNEKNQDKTSVTVLEKPYLSEIIDYDRDILPHQFIKIYAGVGSGKNFFIDHLVKGDYFKHADGSLVEKKHLLLVTSRRAKADEQRASENAQYDERIGIFDDESALFQYADDEMYDEMDSSPKKTLPDYGGLMGTEIRLRSCALTNAQIEKAWKEYLPAESITHPWERFDMIVIDEVHALLSDATYQSAPFYVRRLIEETLVRSRTCKVIVMTGSPQILRDYSLLEIAYTIDAMNVCRSLTPKKVIFITLAQANKIICDMLEQHEKAVYFANRISRVLTIHTMAKKHTNDSVIVSYSDKERRADLKHHDIDAYEKMLDTETKLRTEMLLPSDCALFISTARNKEGINIKNKDFKCMFVEAYADVDVQQMVGRLREGVNKLYIVVDAPEVKSSEHQEEVSFSENSRIIATLTNYLDNLCEEVGYYQHGDDENGSVLEYRRLESFLEFVHEKFPYIRYDYASKTFVFYPERKIGKAYYANQKEAFSNASSSTGLTELAHCWYPMAQCEVCVPFNEEHKEKIAAYLKDAGWLNPGVSMREKERETILKKINAITGMQWAQLGSALHRYGFDLKMESKKKNCLSSIRKI